MSTVRVVNAVAPIRVCDIGGWTDTWFAHHGAVFNVAVYPYVEVQIEATPRGPEKQRVTVCAENFGEVYALDPDHVAYGRHALLDAAIDLCRPPQDSALRVTVFSNAPPGAAAGTSAAVSVALVGALRALTNEAPLPPDAVASLARRLETEKLGLQCGLQDQLASAYGGVSFIEIDEFPHARVQRLQVPDAVWWELEQRLAVVYVGAPHRSSELHEKVIADLGPDARDDARLEGLRRQARRARDAFLAGDFPALGLAMTEATDLQRALHKDLVCERFEEIISIAREHGAVGCKVNGAGGAGGTVTLLGDGQSSLKRRMLRALAERGYAALPIYLSRFGLRVW
jgi:D-glycero-alpha-D-manno-heptose-7-phosphate kinase